MEKKSSNERKNLLIKTIIIVILLLLAMLASVLYVFLYPKTKVILYDSDYRLIKTIEVKRHSKLKGIPNAEKNGHTFLYWTYENGDEFDPEREVDSESIALYAVYDVNFYTVTYHVQVIDPITHKYIYREDVPTCLPVQRAFGSSITLPTGKNNVTGEWLDEFSARTGHSFVGWTTQLFEEDDENRVVYNAGGEFIIPAGNVDLYATWEKNKWSVALHSGIEYLNEDGTTFLGGEAQPKKDANGEFIIRNKEDRVVARPKIKFLDYLGVITDQFQTLQLTETLEDGILIGASEYDFEGWYLDQDYTIPATDFLMEVNVDTEGKPYLKYSNEDVECRIESVVNEDGTYEFQLFSKWRRRAYNLIFDKNSNGSNGKVEKVEVYKYDDGFGKYYNTDVFTRENQKNGMYYNQVDLSNPEITTEKFIKSNEGSRFMGWTITNQLSDLKEGQWYYKWNQDPTSGLITYINNTYRHEVSENVTLFAQWSRIWKITFAENASMSSKKFTTEGIEGEWLPLPNSSKINELGWTKEYSTFAGWTTSLSNNTAPKYFEYNQSGEPNSEYKYTIGRSNVVLYVIWQKIEYEIKFYLNNGAENGGKGTLFKTFNDGIYGGTRKFYPETPKRDGYIFDGWTSEKYADNALNKTGYTSKNSFLVIGDAEYYASWTKNFTIKYNLNGGTGILPKSSEYKNVQVKDPNAIKISLTIGSNSQMSRDNYDFNGWIVKKSNGEFDYENIIKPRINFAFNFTDMEFYKTAITNVKYPITLLEGDYGNELVLYAYWTPKQYDIRLVNTANNDKVEIMKASNEMDFTFPGEEEFSMPGLRFVGWSATKMGPLAYSTEEGYTMIMERSLITRNYTFYTVYENKNILVSYKYKNTSGDEINYMSKSIAYNTVLTHPSAPSAGAGYGDSTYQFTYWYYLDGNNQEVIVSSGDVLRYDGDNLILWAKFEKQQYDIKFYIESPKSVSDKLSIIRSVDKASAITSDFVEEIMGEVNTFLENINVKEFSFDNFYDVKTGIKFETGRYFAASSYSGINLVDGYGINLNFVGRFTPNYLNIVYRTTEDTSAADFQEKNNYYTANTIHYNSKSIILASGDIFGSLGEGVTITSWYIPDTTNKYFQISSPLFSAGITSFTDLNNYIVWEKVGDTYRGTLYLYAETQQVFTIKYYRYYLGNEVLIGEDTTLYTGANSFYTLKSGNIAIYGDLVFNNWKLGSIEGSIANNNIPLSKEEYPDFQVSLYADMSYKVSYVYYNEAMIKTTYSEQTYSYYRDGAYVTTIDIVAPDFADSRVGYTYYGLKYKENVYTLAQVNNKEFTVYFDGENKEFLIMLTRDITIEYTLNSTETETFILNYQQADETETTENQIRTYTIGYDGSQIGAGVKVEAIIATRSDGSYFRGYNIRYSESVLDSKIYAVGETIMVGSDVSYINFVPKFEMPSAGYIDGFIVYMRNFTATDTSRVDVAIKNGTSYILLGGDDPLLDYHFDNYELVAWDYAGTRYEIGSTFTTPLIMNEGQEFVFKGIYIEKYRVQFNSVYYEATNKPTTQVLRSEQQLKLDSSFTPYINEETIFSYWTYNLNGEEIKIYEGDTISFQNGITYRTENTLNGTKHFFPAKNEIWTYTLIAVWQRQQYTLTLNVTDPTSNSVVYTYDRQVEYGDSFEPRDLLDATALSYESNTKGIIGWYDSVGSSIALDSLLQNITSNLTLYTVWQIKYEVTYATGATYEYSATPNHQYFFVGEKVTFDTGVIKSIYNKGSYTIYYENGNYVVTTDTPNNGEYYVVTGFSVAYTGGTSSVVSLSEDNGFITTEARDVTLTPIIERVYQVQFKKNDGTDEVLFTEYSSASYNSTLVLSRYNATRTNYELVGWNTEATATTPLTTYEMTADSEQDTCLYAIWRTDLRVTFYFNSNNLFSVELDHTSKINAETFNNCLDPNSSEYSRMKRIDIVEGDYNTFVIDNVNYYLQYFEYQGTQLNMAQLLNNQFIDHSQLSVKVVLSTIYSINYITGDYDDLECSYTFTDHYITKGVNANGQITSDGVKDYYVPNPNAPVIKLDREYYSAEKFNTSMGGIGLGYAFGSKIEDLTQLISYADPFKNINMYVIWTPKLFNINIMSAFDNGTDTHINPYEIYSLGSDASSVKSALHRDNRLILDSKGIAQNAIADNSLAYPFGTSFYVALPVVDNSTWDYVQVGWSNTLYPLGEIPETYYFATDRTQLIEINEELIAQAESGVINFYPVYQLKVKYLEVYHIYGQYTYTITNNDKLKNFIYDGEFDCVETTQNDLYISTLMIPYYCDIEIKATMPNAHYQFGNFSGVGTTDVLTPTIRTISYDDIGSHLDGEEDHSSHILVINYTLIEANINFELRFSQELKNSEVDPSTLTISCPEMDLNEVLASNNSTRTIALNDYNTYTLALLLSDNYQIAGINIDGITLGASSTFRLSDLEKGDGTYNNVIVTLEPRTYNVSFVLSGGELPEDAEHNSYVIIVSNDTYTLAPADYSVLLDINNSAKISVGSIINLPIPTREDYLFTGWLYNGNIHNDTYEVTDHTVFIAQYINNKYKLNYKIENNTIEREHLGGQSLAIGDGVVFNEPGKTITGWIESISGGEFTPNTIIETETRDYTFVAVINYANDLQFKYQYGAGNSLNTTISNVTYCQDFTTLTTSSLESGYEIANKYIYGWQVEGSSTILLPGTKYQFDILDYSYDPADLVITLTAVYYNLYTYTFIYDLDSAKTSTTISNYVYSIKAIDATGNILETDKSFTISNITPMSLDNAYMFGDYSVEIDGTLVPELKLVVGGKITLVDPTKSSYTYTLRDNWVVSSSAKSINVYVTDPTNTSNTVKLNGGSDDYYTINVILSNILTSSNFPLNNYTNNWFLGVESNVVFTTNIDNIAKWKVIGFTLKIPGQEDQIISLDTLNRLPSEHSELEYSLYTIWQLRYYVNILDKDNVTRADLSGYYDQGASILLPSEDVYSYIEPGFVHIGYTTLAQGQYNFNNENYYNFSTYINSIDDDYTLRPAFTPICNIEFDYTSSLPDNMRALFNPAKLTNNYDASGLPQLTTYFGGPIVDLSRILVYTTSDFTFAYYTLSLASPSSITGYIFDANDVIEIPTGVGETKQYKIVIYAQWNTSSYEITFQLNGFKNNGQLVIADENINSVKLNYSIGAQDLTNHYNWQSVEQLKRLLTDNSYEFIGYYDATNGVDLVNNLSNYLVSGAATIQLNFTPIYRLKYEINPANIESFKADQEGAFTARSIVSLKTDLSLIPFDPSEYIEKPGYQFSNWYVGVNKETSIYIQDAVTLNYNIIESAYDLADDDYIIHAYINWEHVQVKINLHYINDSEKLDGYMTNADTATHGQLVGYYTVVENIEVLASTRLMSTSNTSITSILDTSLQNEIGHNLYDLMTQFSDDNIEVVNVKVGDLTSEAINIMYYVTTDDAVINLYLIYSKGNINVGVQTVITNGTSYINGDNLTSYTWKIMGDNVTYMNQVSGINSIMAGSSVEINNPTIMSSYMSDSKYYFIGFAMANNDWIIDPDNADYKTINTNFSAEGFTFITDINDFGALGVSVDGTIVTFNQSRVIYLIYGIVNINIDITIVTEDDNYEDFEPSIMVDGVSLNSVALDENHTYSFVVGNNIDLLIEASNPDLDKYIFNGFTVDGRTIDIGTSNLKIDKLTIKSVTEDGMDMGVIGTHNSTHSIELKYSLRMMTVYLKQPEIEIDGKTYTPDWSADASYTSSVNNSLSVFKISNPADHDGYTHYTNIPYDAVIGVNFVNTTINNYSLEYWTITNRDGSSTTQLSGTDTYTIQPTALDDRIYCTPVYSANNIIIKYVDQAGKPILIETGTIPYGDTYDLQTIVVDYDNTISYAWNLGDFGEEIIIASENNIALVDNTFVITAVAYDKHFVSFTNGSIVFTLSTTYTDLGNEYYVVEKEHQLTNVRYLDRRSDPDNTTIAPLDAYVIHNSVTIPNEPIESVDGVEFSGFVSRGNSLYRLGDTYTYAAIDVDGGNIVLTSSGSDEKIIKFYITDPNASGAPSDDENLKIATTDKSAYDLPYFPMTIKCAWNEGNFKLNDAFVTITGSDIDRMTWGYNGKKINYFTINNSILDNYEFVGWSTARLDNISNMDTFLSNSSNSSLVLNYIWSDGVRADNTEKYEQLYNLINSGSNIFYAIWEVKHNVTFNATGSAEVVYTGAFSLTTKQPSGVKVTMPNPYYYDLRKAGDDKSKWLGWENVSTQYLFSNTDSIITDTIGANESFTPVWQSGVKVYFNTNFGIAKNYFGNVMQYSDIFPENTSAETIINNMSDPILMGGNLVEPGKYIAGDLWVENEEILFTNYSDGFFYQDNIYFSGSRFRYFKLLGWVLGNSVEYNENSTIYTSASTYVIPADCTTDLYFYAIWKPADVTISYYRDEDCNYPYFADTNNIVYKTMKIPFGYTLEWSNSQIGVEGVTEPEYKYSHLAEEGTYYTINLDDYNIGYNDVRNMRFIEWRYGNTENAVFDKNSRRSAYINSDIDIYTHFVDEYRVQYYFSDGSDIPDQNEIQKVIVDEDITVGNTIHTLLGDNLKYTDSVTIRSKNKEMTYLTGEEVITLDNINNFALNGSDDHLIQIFVDCTFLVNTYLAKTTTGTIIPINTNISINATEQYVLGDIEGSFLSDNSIDATFDGWKVLKTEDNNSNKVAGYNSETPASFDTSLAYADIVTNNSNYYNINEEGINLFTIKFADGVFKIFDAKNNVICTINNSAPIIEEDPIMKGASISLYAKLVVNTIISIDSKTQGKFEEKTSDNNYIIKSKTNQTGLKIISYTSTSIYNNSANLSLVVNGLEEGHILNDVVTGNYTSSITRDYQYENNNLFVDHTININNICSKEVNITLSSDLIKYTITLENLITDGQIRFKETTDSEYHRVAEYENTYITFTQDDQDDQIAVDIVYSVEGDKETLIVSNVPYGKKVYFSVEPTAGKQFDGWNFAEGTSHSASTIWPDSNHINIVCQTFKLSASGTENNTTATLVANVNKIQLHTINLTLRFEADEVNDSLWYGVLEASSINSDWSCVEGVYTWDWKLSDIETTAAINSYSGEHPAEKLWAYLNNKFKEDFINNLSSSIGTSEGDGPAALAIDHILDYFWFDNTWTITAGLPNTPTFDNVNQEYLLIDNELNLYTTLRPAVLVKVDQMVNNISGGATRAKFANPVVTKNGSTANMCVDYFVYGNDAGIMESLPEYNLTSYYVKMPVDNYTMSAECILDEATESHVSYFVNSWTGEIKSGNTFNIVPSTAIYATNYPEIYATAYLEPNTYNVVFEIDDAQTITLSGIAYDVDYGIKSSLDSLKLSNMDFPIFKLENTTYTQDHNRESAIFAHSDDAAASEFGQFKHLFNTWKYKDGSAVTQAGLVNALFNYNNGTYSDVVLQASWFEYSSNTSDPNRLVEINYKYYSYDKKEQNVQTIIAYLPYSNNLIDLYGNVYLNSLAGIGFVEKELNTNIGGTIKGYYVGDTQYYNVKALASGQYTVDIWAGIERIVTIYTGVIPSNDNKITYELVALGGRLLLEVNNGNMSISNCTTTPGTIDCPIGAFAFWEYGDEFSRTKISGSLDTRKSINVYAHYNPTMSITNFDGEGEITVPTPSGDVKLTEENSRATIKIFTTIPSNVELSRTNNDQTVKISSSGAGTGSGNSYLYITHNNFGTITTKTITYKPSSSLQNTIMGVQWIISYNMNGASAPLTIIRETTDIFQVVDGMSDISIYPQVLSEPYTIEIANNRYKMADTGAALAPFAITNITGYDWGDYIDLNNTIVSLPLLKTEERETYEDTPAKLCNNILPQGSVKFSEEYYKNTNYYVLSIYDDYVSDSIASGDELSWVNLKYKIRVPKKSKITSELNNGNLVNLRWQYLNASGYWQDVNAGYTPLNKSGNCLYGDNRAITTPTMLFRIACDYQTYEYNFTSLKRMEKDRYFGTNTNVSVTGGGSTYSISYKDIVETADNDSEWVYVGKGTIIDIGEGNYSVTYSGEQKSYGKYSLEIMKGDTLTYYPTLELFQVTESINANIQGLIIRANPDMLARKYNQGWFKYDSGNKKLLNFTALTNNQDGDFVIWLDDKVTLNVTADTQTIDADIVNGLGKLTIEAITAKGYVSSPVDEVDPNKYYYIYSTGISNRLKISAANTTDFGHKFVKYSYIYGGETATKTSPTLNISKLSEYISDNTKKEGTIKVLYNAKDTMSKYIVARSDRSIQNGVGYTIYGGYKITYTTSERHYLVVIKDFFGDTKHTFAIGIYDNSTKPAGATDIFNPKEDYIAENTYHNELAENLSVVSSKVTNALPSTTSLPSEDVVVKPVGSTAINIVDIMQEVPYRVSLYIKVVKVSADGKNTNNYIESTDIAKLLYTEYLGDLQSGNYDGLKTYIKFDGINSINEDSLKKFYMHSDTRVPGIIVKIGGNEGAPERVVRSKLNLLSVNLAGQTVEMPSKNADTGVYAPPVEGNIQETFISECKYTLTITVQDTPYVYVVFKSTLPHISDLRNLGLTKILNNNQGEGYNITYSGSSQYQFADKLINNYNADLRGIGLRIPRDSKITISDKTYSIIDTSGRTVLQFSINVNTNMYTYDKSNPLLVDKGSGYLMYNKDTYSINNAGILGANYQYELYSYNASAVQATHNMTLDSDCALVIALKRKEVNITIDTNYWGKNWEGDETLNKVFDEGRFSNNATTLKVPGGLVKLTLNPECTYYTQLETEIQTPSTLSAPVTLVNIYVADRDVRDANFVTGITPNQFVGTHENYHSNKLYIVGRGVTGYNVELSSSSTWAIINAPSAEPKITATFYNNNVEKVQLGTTYNIAMNSTLLDLPIILGGPSDNASLTYYIARVSDSRLWYGLFGVKDNKLDTDKLYYNNPVSLNFTPHTSLVLVGEEEQTKIRAIVGWDIVFTDPNKTTVKITIDKDHTLTGEQLTKYNGYSNVHFYPIWDKVDKGYIVSIIDDDNWLGLSKEAKNQLVLEGGRYTSPKIAQTSYRGLVLGVNSEGIDSSTAGDVKKYIVHEENGVKYLFVGFSTNSNSGMYKGKTDKQYKLFGMYCIDNRELTTNYNNITSNMFQFTGIMSENKYISNETSTDIKPSTKSLTLYPVWRRVGYSVTYTPDNNGKAHSSYTLRSTHTTSAQTISYDNRIIDMPFKLGYNLTIDGDPNYFTARNYKYSNQDANNFGTPTGAENNVSFEYWHMYHDTKFYGYTSNPYCNKVGKVHYAARDYKVVCNYCYFSDTETELGDKRKEQTTYTYTNNGKHDGITKCSFCQEELSKITGQDCSSDEKTWTEAPTCVSKGKYNKVCKLCKGVYVQDQVGDSVDENNHNWNIHLSVESPTCTTKGYPYYACLNGCSKRNTDITIPIGDEVRYRALGHTPDYKGYVFREDEQKYNDSYLCYVKKYSYTCGRCGESNLPYEEDVPHNSTKKEQIVYLDTQNECWIKSGGYWIYCTKCKTVLEDFSADTYWYNYNNLSRYSSKHHEKKTEPYKSITIKAIPAQNYTEITRTFNGYKCYCGAETYWYNIGGDRIYPEDKEQPTKRELWPNASLFL